MIKHYQSGDEDDEKSRLEGFERFAQDYIKIMEDKREEIGQSAWERWIQNVHENKVEASILANGLYWKELSYLTPNLMFLRALMFNP